MPLTGLDSNAVVSSEGDIIELVIHSPHKSVLHHRRPSEWFFGGGSGSGSGGGDRAENPQSVSLRDGGGGERKHERVRRQRMLTPTSIPSSNDDEDVLSILSASELIAAEDSAPSQGAITAAAPPPTTDQGPVSSCRGTSYGRLADAFSEKWGAWVHDSNSSDSNDDTCAKGERIGHGGVNSVQQSSTRDSDGGRRDAVGGAQGRSIGDGSYNPSGGRSAREFDREALLQSPYESRSTIESPNFANDAADGAENGDRDGGGVAHRLRCFSSTSSVPSEGWLWRHRHGVLSRSSSDKSVGDASSQCGGSTAAERPDYGPAIGAGMHDGSGVVRQQELLLKGQLITNVTGKLTSSMENRSGAKTRPRTTGVGVEDETKATARELRISARGQEAASGEATTSSLLEVEL